MAVIIRTTQPSAVLDSIKAAIKENEIQTWICDTDGDFTHTPTQWLRLAWMRPRMLDDRLIFRIVRPKGKSVSVATYAVYHGRFIEMVLRHADELITEATATSSPSNGDQV